MGLHEARFRLEITKERDYIAINNYLIWGEGEHLRVNSSINYLDKKFWHNNDNDSYDALEEKEENGKD